MAENGPSCAERAKLIAFHLPQFYPTPYNDEWWGKGFTEWTNVVKAYPRFRGHYQPHLPADLGFYDLRLPEAREAQATLAAEYGIHGFCYYHYWFNGKMLLEKPVDEILRLGTPDFPFCLCWANENWTRAWDGRDKQVLMEQIYSDEDDLRHICWLVTAFADPRYIRVNGRPLFLIYRSARLPDPKKTTDRWREEATRLGIGDLYLCHVENIFGEARAEPTQLGFDAAVEFQPKLSLIPAPLSARVKGKIFPKLTNTHISPYSELVKNSLAEARAPYRRYPCVCPSWDNTPRRPRRGLTLKGSTPQEYEHWLRETIKRTEVNSDGDKIIFVNAWNEWAEGCHLEPCQKWGRQYLAATLRAKADWNEK